MSRKSRSRLRSRSRPRSRSRSRSLGWCSTIISILLRFPERIEYKLAVLAYRCLHGLGPSYLADEFIRVSEIESRRHLRSASTASLVVPRFQRKTLGGRAFPVAAAQTWNSLPSHVTSCSSLTSFKRCLKTELFQRSYIWASHRLINAPRHFLFFCFVFDFVTCPRSLFWFTSR